MKTVCIFCGYFLPHLGGIERYIDNVSRQFKKKKINVIVVSSNFNDDKSFEVINDITYIRLPIHNCFKNRYPILKKNKEFKELISKLDDYEIDAIIVNTRFHLTSHVGANYGKHNNIPVYLIEHGSNYVTLDNKFIDFFANRYEDFLTRRIKSKITKFYGVSIEASTWLQHFKINDAGVWYNSIDIDQKLPKKVKHKTINFMYAGRLIQQKGVENILDSFVKLSSKYSNLVLYIAGDGPKLNDYKNKYCRKNIKFLGKIDYETLLTYYAKTDVFLYPPLWPEGLPTSILEAGLMGCCVIGTRQGGIKEIIDHNKNGLMAECDKDSLYNCMELLIVNPEMISKFSKQLNKDIKMKFSWEKTAGLIAHDIGVLK